MPKSDHEPEQPKTRTTQTASETSSFMLQGKGLTLAPQLSTADGNLELKNMPNPEAAPAEDHDIMQLSRLGDVEGVRKLFDEGLFRPDYCDDEGITPLHWAAINNQYAMCKFLLEYRITEKNEEGEEEIIQVDVNKPGGESTATPAMWAAQRSHYYVVHLLFQYGANPTLTDIQGYNILHLATFEGNVFLLVLLLHQNIPVDVRDAHGHTSLMWAAYKGFPACADLFLRWGADVHATDETGFTALHWALVKGAKGCIQKLVEYGSDRFQPAANGKTPSVMAQEMNTLHAWHSSLKECGYKDNGRPVAFDFPGSSYILKSRRNTMAKFFFFWPFLVMWCMFMEVSHMVVYAGIPIALFTGFFLQWVAQQVMVYAPPDMRQLHKTPWLAGIFAGTLFFGGLRWATTMLPATYTSYPISNTFFAVAYSLCAYFYFCTMFLEPGYVPKLNGLTEQKETIDQLLQDWKFDEQNFCVHCMVRMPLRSKHCRRCNRCIAKHDHHCPWVYNCVGVNNHRHFFLYLVFLEIGVALLVNIAYGYFTGMGTSGSTECNVLSAELCRYINKDAYTMVLLTWAALQLTWVTMLLFVQIVQIARAMTTYENMRGAHHHSGSGAADAITTALTTGSTSMAGAGLSPDGRGPDPADPAGHKHHHDGCFKQWKKILGVDTFVETALHKDSNKNTRNRNPFSRGCITNCKDFWCDPAPLFGGRENGVAMLDGQVVNYTTMYEPPSRMRARRTAGGGLSAGYERVEDDDGEIV